MKTVLVTFFFILTTFSYAQDKKEENPAFFWMDMYLEAIRKDGFGPTVHARNMYHLSAIMYDTWLVYNPDKGKHLFLGKNINGFEFKFDGFNIPEKRDSCMNVSLHYAAFHLLELRFSEYSSKVRVMDDWIFGMEDLGFNPSYKNSDYSNGSPAALGIYIAELMYNFGMQEGAGDADGYEGPGANPVNPVLEPNVPGNKNLIDYNRWQPLSVRSYINEKGWDSTLLDWNYQLIPTFDEFLTPHWGIVHPFAIPQQDQQVLSRNGMEFIVHNDPGAPPTISKVDSLDAWDEYCWNFSLVTSWSGHNDPNDKTQIDISPGAVGPTENLLPNTFKEYKDFFNFQDGGTHSIPNKKNPFTNEPYVKNIVKRGDYTRTIAEFWVDAVNTYSPPGHWMKMLHEVSDNPEFTKKWNGQGKDLSELEWSIKSQLILSGALHDAAISAWSVKAYYDYIRPISAIRWMSDNGQCSDSLLPNYHKHGMPLIKDKIALVNEKDPLVGDNLENLNKIKIWAWRGPDNVEDVDKDVAGAGWILAENWWPYQRYSFVTPPFAGYVSGHSCFSIAAATTLELITGSPYFPGGLKEKVIEPDFLEFELGPSESITLQWATFREAADETCLSRIWGGIHPPIDDIRGRKVGKKVALDAVEVSKNLFN